LPKPTNIIYDVSQFEVWAFLAGLGIEKNYQLALTKISFLSPKPS